MCCHSSIVYALKFMLTARHPVDRSKVYKALLPHFVIRSFYMSIPMDVKHEIEETLAAWIVDDVMRQDDSISQDLEAMKRMVSSWQKDCVDRFWVALRVLTCCYLSLRMRISRASRSLPEKNRSLRDVTVRSEEFSESLRCVALAIYACNADLPPLGRSVDLQRGRASGRCGGTLLACLLVATSGFLGGHEWSKPQKSDVPFDLPVVLIKDAPVAREAFSEVWQRVGEGKQQVSTGSMKRPLQAEAIRNRLAVANVNYVAQRQVDSTIYMYFSATTSNNGSILAELLVSTNSSAVEFRTRTEAPVLYPLFESAVRKRLGLK